MNKKKRYVLVGTGGRSVMYVDAIGGEFRDVAELVGFCDISRTRMTWYNNRLAEMFKAPRVPMYDAADFERMIEETDPDEVIVTTMDGTHHEYIVRAMDMGRDVICEKPLTTDARKMQAVFDAIERTGKKLRVTFNLRYAAHVTKVRELIMQGVIGQPLSVDLAWMLDTKHGADYFRRWHAEKDKSGGLQIHKSTHHFDLVNWWIDSYPTQVFAMGDLKFYGRRNAEARGEKARTKYDRYTNQPLAKDDPFALDLNSDPNLKALYLDAEPDNGYIRDKNVFGNHITIEDTLAVSARYANGVLLNYSLTAYSPWEGWRVAITGTKGRIELQNRQGSHIIAGQGDAELAHAQAVVDPIQLTVIPMFGAAKDIPVVLGEGGHGGGDPIMLEQIFSPKPPADPFRRAASHIDGASSALVGICINESIRTGQCITVDDLFPISSYKAGRQVVAVG